MHTTRGNEFKCKESGMFQLNLWNREGCGTCLRPSWLVRIIHQSQKIQTHSCCWCHWTVTSHSALTIYCLSVTAFRRAFAECVGGFIHVRNGSRAYFILIIKTKTVALSLVCSQICPALCLHSVFSGTAPLMESETGQLWDVDKLFESTCCVSLEMYIPALHK